MSITRKLCPYCNEPVEPGEAAYMEGVELTPIIAPLDSKHRYHADCLIRAVSGSVGHQRRECQCFGKVDTSEDGLTTREAARRAADFWRVTHPPL